MTSETTDELRPEQYRSYLLVLARINLRTWGPVAHKVDASNVVQEALLQARTRGGVSFRHTAAKAGLCPIMPGFLGILCFFRFFVCGGWRLGRGMVFGQWVVGWELVSRRRFVRICPVFPIFGWHAVRNCLPEHLQRVLTFAYVTGWRVPSEVLTLKWSQVDFQGATVSLDPGTTKNDEGRVFPFTDQLRDALAEQRRFTDETQRKLRVVIPWVFHRADGKRIAGFRKAWARACYNAGLPCHVETEIGKDGKVRIKKTQAVHIPHDLRRSSVRNLVRAGIPERVAMALSGHKTRSVFERYNIVSGADLQDAARRLDAFQTGSGINAGTNTGTMTASAARVKS